MPIINARNPDASYEDYQVVSHPNSVAEQVLWVFDPSGLRTKMLGIWLDLVNLTQNVTIRVKSQIDGVNSRTFDSLAWLTTDDDGVFISPFTINGECSITLQSAVLEGVARNIPTRTIWQPVEHEP